MITFRCKNQTVHLSFRLYADLKLNLRLLTQSGEPFVQVTSNRNVRPEQGVIGIKDWNENAGIIKELANAGIIKPLEHYSEICSDFASIKFHELTNKAIKTGKEQHKALTDSPVTITIDAEEFILPDHLSEILRSVKENDETGFMPYSDPLDLTREALRIDNSLKKSMHPDFNAFIEALNTGYNITHESFINAITKLYIDDLIDELLTPED